MTIRTPDNHEPVIVDLRNLINNGDTCLLSLTTNQLVEQVTELAVYGYGSTILYYTSLV